MGSISPATTTEESLTCIAAKRLERISKGEFSNEVREKASLCFLDFLGAAQSGLLGQLSRSVLKYCTLRPGKPEAYVFGMDNRVGAEMAAFTNAILAHR
jgi:2-methylcitrate dehydratase PrpD